jgi:hypothetical protein
MCLEERKPTNFSHESRITQRFGQQTGWLQSNFFAPCPDETQDHAPPAGNPGMSVEISLISWISI